MHARPAGRVDDAPCPLELRVLVDEDRVGVARQVLAKGRRDQVVLGERDDPDQRAGERPAAHDRLHDLQRLSQRRLVGDPKERPRLAAPHRRGTRGDRRTTARRRPTGPARSGRSGRCGRAAAPPCCRGPSARARRPGSAPLAGDRDRSGSSPATAPGASARPRGSRSCRAARRRGSRRTAGTPWSARGASCAPTGRWWSRPRGRSTRPAATTAPARARSGESELQR